MLLSFLLDLFEGVGSDGAESLGLSKFVRISRATRMDSSQPNTQHKYVLSGEYNEQESYKPSHPLPVFLHVLIHESTASARQS